MIKRYFPIFVITLVSAAAILLIPGLQGHSAVSKKPLLELIRNFRLRGAYFGIGEALPQEIHKIRAVGMNAILVKLGAVDVPLNSLVLKTLNDIGNAAHKAGLHLIVVFDYRKGPEIFEGYRREVDNKGRRWKKTPCPADPKYWKRWVLDRAQAIADVSRKYGIVGVVADIEMYGSEYDHRSYGRLCYCDECFREFIGTQGVLTLEHIPPPADRSKWIRQRGLEHNYEMWLENRVKSLAADVRNAVHKINPELMLGGLGIDRPFPFERGILSGLGTKDIPALCFTELSYDKGFSSEIVELRNGLEKGAGKILFVTGFNIASIPVDNLAEQAFEASTKTDGYWIWSFKHLLRDIPAFAGYQLRSRKPAYWNSLLTANMELDQYAESGGSYSSSLRIRTFDPLLPFLSSNRLDEVRLSQSCKKRSDSLLSPASLPYIQGYSSVYIPAKRGSQVKVRITSIDRYPLLFWRSEKVHYAVFGSDGSMPEEGFVPSGESRIINWMPEKDGLYAIAAKARQSAYQIEVLSGQPFGFKATEEYPLHIYHDLERLFFCVPEESGELYLNVKSKYRNPSQRKTIIIFSPDGLERKRVEGEFAEWTEIRLPDSGKSQGGTWSVKTEGIADKFSLYLSKNISQIFYTHSDQPLREEGK